MQSQFRQIQLQNDMTLWIHAQKTVLQANLLVSLSLGSID